MGKTTRNMPADHSDPMEIMTEGPLVPFRSEETYYGNQGARLPAYIRLRQTNLKKMQEIVDLIFEPEGLGFVPGSNKAEPRVMKSLIELLNELKRNSERAVRHIHPSYEYEDVSVLSTADLDSLYPIKLPEVHCERRRGRLYNS